MAYAVGLARDSIVGYWKADASSLASPKKPSSFDDLKYLSGARRFETLSGEVLSAFQIKPDSKGASLFVAPMDLSSLSDGAETSLKPTKVCELKKPTMTELKKQMIWVRNYADLRMDRTAEISEQTGAILPFFGGVGLLNDSRRKATWEILGLVQTICVVLEMRMKHFCWSPRPVDFAQEVQPIIQTPDHSTYPSGHATEAFAIATVLYHLMQKSRLMDVGGGEPPMLVRIAHRIAVNRTVAGVHFPVDSAAGAMLGTAIGEAIIGLAEGAELAKTDFGLKTKLPADDDFTQKWFMDNKKVQKSDAVPELALLKRAYERAQAEW